MMYNGRVRTRTRRRCWKAPGAAAGRVDEDAEMEHTLQREQHDGDGEDRGASTESGWWRRRPKEKRHAEPGHTGGAHAGTVWSD